MESSWVTAKSIEEDRLLIARTRGGDCTAFEALYNKYKGQVYRTALAIVRDQGAAEDILQDCFIKVYTNIDRIDSSLPLVPWLYRVTVNLSYNWVTRRKRWLTPLEAVIDRLNMHPRIAPEQAVEENELQQVVQEAIYSLSFEQRVVLILFYLTNFSIREIAYILDVPEGTVKSRLYYGREKLRQKLLSDQRLSLGVAYEWS
ncbi:MAG: sigma-70 family RNA polymerase sigma factor [Anaerolineae bacterium]|nr:sigma-70 family RNA polymerase sigma factor [Anaerolineae bacterium]MDH7474750.1 sigma-70 family RNA polymerase sigma factor [Anaerolineae bacterium]